MAGQSGSNIAAASVGGYELALGSKPRELAFVASGFIPQLAGTSAYVTSSGAFATGLAAAQVLTAGSGGTNGGSDAGTVTDVATALQSHTVDGEVLSRVAATFTTAITSNTLDSATLTASGQYIKRETDASLTLPGVAPATGSGTAVALPLVDTVKFGAGSLTMDFVSDTVMGHFVFGAGDGSDDLNIVDAQISMAIDGNANLPLSATTSQLITDIGNGNDAHTKFNDAGVSAGAASITGTSGGTVFFTVAAGENDELAAGKNYRLSIRALAHPKGGI